MNADMRFRGLPPDFWANVRTISEYTGYTVRSSGQIKVPSLREIARAFDRLDLDVSALFIGDDTPTRLGSQLIDYFVYRADVLNNFVQPRLMDVDRARQVFDDLRRRLSPQCSFPMNKQKGAKRSPAFLTGCVNMLIEQNRGDHTCDYDPRSLMRAVQSGRLLRTLSRRLDGAFPSITNPIAVWEIKEYYYTTTFGSRVADGIYESLLDGMELEEIRKNIDLRVRHYLMIDGKYTWWDRGRSYLCRLIDILHMGYIDEVLFGYEVIERLPALVEQWRAAADAR